MRVLTYFIWVNTWWSMLVMTRRLYDDYLSMNDRVDILGQVVGWEMESHLLTSLMAETFMTNCYCITSIRFQRIQRVVASKLFSFNNEAWIVRIQLDRFMKPLEEILELLPFLSFDLHNNYFPKNDQITSWHYHDLFFIEAQFLKIPSNDTVTCE